MVDLYHRRFNDEITSQIDFNLCSYIAKSILVSKIWFKISLLVLSYVLSSFFYSLNNCFWFLLSTLTLDELNKQAK